MVGSAAAVYAHNDPVMTACMPPGTPMRRSGRSWTTSTDSGDRQDRRPRRAGRRTAQPISDDLPALVRTLTAATAMMLIGDTAFVGRGDDVDRAVEIVEQLWLNALWGGGQTH